VVVVVLVADFLWHVIVALIDRKLAGTLEAGPDGSAHAARLQTLLPITRNLSLAALVAIAGTMVLASLGVEIGPLIASAGVVGVAIGFGAQTLVKDIISGVFYLVDDAFRIGEYIQSGTYKGTVESFSLRSVKLRHQRGALYTIPFGTLGAVQNLSRDWVVDKILLNVPYGTDIDAVRRIMKRIGTELLADEELSPGIIKTLKLQGVSQFGDYAIKLQTKMMTVPGDVQFAARRRALLLIQRDFEAQGIGFALPVVQVSGEGAGRAAAGAALSMMRTAEATAAAE
jgi:small-conductance mechanosensitive channel